MPTPLNIPSIGLGTWDLRGADCIRSVREALALGYRHLDTARMYDNEREVGRGIAESGVDRVDVFITTKLWLDGLTLQGVASSVESSLRGLGTDYLDLLLIHWPNPDVPLEETLSAMGRELDRGRVRAVGVSNFPRRLWRRALELAPVGVNQVEWHPYLDQTPLLEFARERKLRLIAYTPIAKGRVHTDPVISQIAADHGVSEVQVALRWLIEQGACAIPKSSRVERLRENLNIFDLRLSESEMMSIAGLARGLRLVNPGWSPEWD